MSSERQPILVATLDNKHLVQLILSKTIFLIFSSIPIVQWLCGHKHFFFFFEKSKRERGPVLQKCHVHIDWRLFCRFQFLYKDSIRKSEVNFLHNQNWKEQPLSWRHCSWKTENNFYFSWDISKQFNP